MALTEYMRNRLAFIESGRPLPEKKKYIIPKVSEKRKAKINEQTEAGGENEMDKFFSDMRKLMVGVCQCGCSNKSQKDDDTFYRNCIAHIFPKRIFKSIAKHRLNWVERSFWNGCHTNMDNKSMDEWKNFADFEDIKERFHELAPLLTDEERANKFYSNLEKLVYNNP